MKKIVFALVITALSINLKAQQIIDTVFWVWVNNADYYSETDGPSLSKNENLSIWLLNNNIHYYKQAYPFAKTPELLKIHEIRCLPGGNINDIYQSLNSAFNNAFSDISYFVTADTTVTVYNPADWMWVAHADDWLWHLKKIQADLGWDISKGDPNVKIAIIDTDFDITHPDLSTEIEPSFDPYTNYAWGCTQGTSHGTTVASMASAETTESGQTPNGMLASVGFKTKIIGYKSSSSRQIVLQKALHASTVMGAQVIVSCAGYGSLGCSPMPETGEELVIKEILDNGTVIISPAGNGYTGTHCKYSNGDFHSFYPFNPEFDSRIIVVSSTEINDYHYYYNTLHNREETHSHFPEVDICAPGYEIMGAASTFCDPNIWPYYGSNSGTSFSSPIVAGACALLKSLNPNFTPGEIEYFIKATADPIIDEAQYPGLVGAGRLNIYKALQLAADCNPIVISSPETWYENRDIVCDLIIEDGGILTIKGITKISHNARIIVKRGGVLCVDGGNLSNLDNKYLWRGIEVWGNSELSQIPQSNQGWVRVINGGKIENAICAIKTFRPTEEDNGTPMQNYTGGIVQADGAIFKNNRTAVHFLGYNHNNLSYFQNCIFETTEALKDNSIPDYFVKLEGVTNVRFTGCSFENKITPGSIQVEDRGSGIYAINSDIILWPFCTQSINPCPEIDYQRNLFKNLYRGVYGLSTGPDKMVSIDRTDFETNYRGLYLSAMNYATLTRNYVHVWEEQFTQNPQTYGFYLDQCTGYHIESNNFNSENTAQRGIGLIIHKSGQANNMVYNNNFSNLRIATQAQDENRGREYDGLCYKCNDFSNNMYDIRATVSHAPINIYSGIAARQGANVPGDNKAPAGNTFTLDEQAAYNLSNFANAFTYFRHQYTSGPKIHPQPNTGSGGITVSSVPYTNYTKTMACPSTLTYGEIEDEKDAMDMAGESESETRLQLQELVDGGNTEILDAQIQSSSTANAGDLYQELMALAPYLSDVVLGSSITKEEVLVDAMIRDILVANPQSAKSDELLDQLEQRANPLPEYMWDEIMQGATFTGAKENLESELVHWMQEKYRHRNNAIRLYLTDLNSAAAMNGLQAFLLEESTFESLRQVAMLKASMNDFTGARAIIAQMAVAFENDPEQISEIDGLSDFVDILESVSSNFNGSYQPGNNNIPALQALYSANRGISGVLSRNYLVHGNELEYDEPIHGDETLKAGNKLRGKNGAGVSAANALLAIFPNPAHDYFIVETSTDDIGLSLQMVTSLGQTIKAQSVNTRKSVVVTKDLKPGLYFVQLVKQDKVLATEKVVIK